MSPPRDKTVCQTSPCKCKICISSIESDVYNKKKIQMFVVNKTFISSSEVKKCVFRSCLRHSWNIHFFTSLDEIKVIFTPNIWISPIYDIRAPDKRQYMCRVFFFFWKSELKLKLREWKYSMEFRILALKLNLMGKIFSEFYTFNRKMIIVRVT